MRASPSSPSSVTSGGSGTYNNSGECFWPSVIIHFIKFTTSFACALSFTAFSNFSCTRRYVKDKAQAKEVVNLIKWMITDGQKHSPELLYVPIPPEVTELGLEGLTRITYNGEKLYDGPTTYSGDGLLSTQAKKIPDWVRNIFKFYGAGQIGDGDLINGLQFLIKEGIIKLQ